MARCTVERRMRALGLTGAGPGRTVRTTGPAKGNPVPDDLLRRDFTAARPNRRWVVDFTYVPTWKVIQGVVLKEYSASAAVMVCSNVSRGLL